MNFRPFSPGELAAHGIDPYHSKSGRTILVSIVVALHVALIVIPILVNMLLNFFQPPKIVMRVGLVDLPYGNTLDAPKEATGKPSFDSPPLPDAAPAPQPEVKPAPKSEVKPTPKPEVKPTPKPEVKPIPKPEVKPTPKPEVKPTPKPKPEPKKTKYLKPEDIRKQAQTARTDPKAEAARKREEAERKASMEKQIAEARAAAQRNADARKQIADAARNAGSAAPVYGSRAGGEKGVRATAEYYDYMEKLKQMLERNWDEPNAVQLDGKRPSVKLTLAIAKDGTVRASDFTRTGNAVMDRSIEELLKRMKTVPPPPAEMSFDVTLRVK